jgi:hypothetical protein
MIRSEGEVLTVRMNREFLPNLTSSIVVRFSPPGRMPGSTAGKMPATTS